MVPVDVGLAEQGRQFIDQFHMRGGIATGEAVDLQANALAWPNVSSERGGGILLARERNQPGF